MKKQPWVSFSLANVSFTDFGLKIPSPFASLEINNSEINSFTSWTLNLTIGGSESRGVNIAAMEALLYSSAQSADMYGNSSGIPVAFSFGWLAEDGTISEYLSYQGFTLQFSVSISGLFTQYKITGYASLALQSSMPVLNIPALTGYVQPSAVVEGLAKAVKATDYYQLDIDHNDSPTLVSHGAMTTSFVQYVRGSYSGEDDYDTFPGLLKLAKSYSQSRDSAGLKYPYKSLSSILNNVIDTPVSTFLKKGLTDNTVQSSSFTFWVDEPTMTKPGVIHFKSTAGLQTAHNSDTLEYGTANSNILTLSGSYNGIAYNMSDMNFSSLGFSVDGSGVSIIQDATVVNSWSSSVQDVFQTANIINDINALATQFSGNFTVTIPGSVKQFQLAQPVSLIVLSGNTLSPISGIYNIVSVSHTISTTFVTTLKIQRLVMSSANEVAAGQGIYVTGSALGYNSTYKTTSNVISTGKVDFGTLYPTFQDIRTV